MAKEYGYLPYMINRYIDFLGLNDTLKLLKANEKPLTPSIRVNTLKIQPEELKNRLEYKGLVLRNIQWISYGFKVLKGTYNLGSLHEYLQGYFYLQNVASMLPAIILDPKPDETVIDMCAAPGGKATHIAQIMNNKGNLLLIERNSKRIPALEINLRRLGIINSIVINLDAIELNKLDVKPDKILLDAPCTGEGLIREDPTRKKSKTSADINKMAKIQRQLLTAGLKALKPGGKLLYSTCSIAPEENELVLHETLQGNSEYAIVKIKEQYGVNGYINIFGSTLREDIQFSQRLFPHLHDTIGFFICLIKRNPKF
ncbi:MAG: RsmB/NOP family class I SAM-dependent RNA methyltransferase [Candidatus Hodarchaeota archaeon]